MNPPMVLIDRSFALALIDHDHPDHRRAVACYAELIDEFEAERILLGMRSDVRSELRPITPAGLFDPCDRVHVAGQHRHAAAAIDVPGVDADLAITLVMLRRERIRRIATFDERLASFDVVVIPGPGGDPTIGPDSDSDPDLDPDARAEAGTPSPDGDAPDES